MIAANREVYLNWDWSIISFMKNIY